MRKVIAIAAVTLFMATTGVDGQPAGNDVAVQAAVDLPQAMVGDTITLTVRIDGANLPDDISPVIKGLDAAGLEVVSKSQSRAITSGSSFTVIINGQTIQRDKDARERVSIEYELRPTRPGDFRLGPAKVAINGKMYESNKVGFTVSTVPSSPGGLQPRGQAFVQAEATPLKAFVGQQVSIKYFLYVRTGIELDHMGQMELPRLDGFIKKDFEQPGKYSVRRRSLGELPYQEIYLGRMVLFPISAGERTIPPLKQGYIDRVKVSDHPFFGPQYKRRERRAQSQKVTIAIIPLPSQGRPADFSGAVGIFALNASVDKNQTRVGESVTLTVEISGAGNLESAADPVLNLPKNARAYPPEKDDSSYMVGDDLRSKRKLKYILAPQEEGTLRLASVSFTFFDPASGVYRRAESRPIAIEALPGVVSALPRSMALPEAQQVTLLGKDIRFIKPDAEKLRDQSSPFYTKPWYWGLHFLPLALLAGAVLVRRRQDKLLTDRGYARRVGANGAAAKGLAKAKALLASGDPSAFYHQLSATLLGFIGDMLNLMPAGLTSGEIARALKAAGAGEDIIESVNALLSRSDAARYAPSSLPADARANDLDAASELISVLGKVFEGNTKK